MTEPLDELARRIASGPVVVIVGAGVTASVSNSPFATWRGLLEDGITYATRVAQQHATPEWVAAVRQNIALGGTDDLVHAGDRIVHALGGRNSPKFGRWLERTIGSIPVDKDDGVLRALDAWNAPILTTNFDTTFERIGRAGTATWCEPGAVHGVFARHERTIIHIRGVWRRPDTVVLGHDAYADLTHAEHFFNILSSAMVHRSVVLVGVGAGGDDPGFAQLWPFLKSTLRNTANPIYQLCRNSEAAAVANDLVTPVPYGDSYSALAPAVARLAPSGIRLEPPPPPGDDAGPLAPPGPSGDDTAPGSVPPPAPRREWTRYGYVTAMAGLVMSIFLVRAVIDVVTPDPVEETTAPTLDERHPLAPRNVEVKDGGDTATLTWEDPSKGDLTFVVSVQSGNDRDFDPWAPGPPKGATEFTLSPLQRNTGYCIVVSSVIGPGAAPGVLVPLRSECRLELPPGVVREQQ